MGFRVSCLKGVLLCSVFVLYFGSLFFGYINNLVAYRSHY